MRHFTLSAASVGIKKEHKNCILPIISAFISFSVTMYSDSSSYYETTYSEDERIANALQGARRLRDGAAADADRARKASFENYAKSDLPIFKMPGVKFHAFRHLKIKFSFHPGTVTNFVNNNVIFYISLRYKNDSWRVKRDSFPANYKWRIYRLFYDQNCFVIGDENILELLVKIHEILLEWTEKEQEFRLEKHERYKKGEDVELDSDDEYLFLDEEERVALNQKKARVLRRMLPPKKR